MLLLALAAILVLTGCSKAKDTWRKVSGSRAPEADLEAEAKYPPESMQEEIAIEGKPWVKSRNPNYLLIPGEPEFIYAEKGREFKGLSDMIKASVARSMGYDPKSKQARGVPEEKVKELVRQEVDRILREQGLRAFHSQDKSRAPGVVGRYVGIYPNPESSRGMEGPNRTLAATLADYLGRQKDLKVAGPDKVKAALGQTQTTGALQQRQNLQALGNNLGIQAVILTGVVPASGKNPNFLVLETYDTFKGVKTDGIAYPVEGRVDLAAIQNFVRNNALRVSASLVDVDWFGRVEFVKEGNVYLSLGDATGLKVGDRLKVVTPGQEVVNPATKAPLGFTGDQSQGELRITELLGNTGAVAQVLSGGPFKPNDKVKAVR
jgi:hypothetical protein